MVNGKKRKKKEKEIGVRIRKEKRALDFCVLMYR